MLSGCWRLNCWVRHRAWSIALPLKPARRVGEAFVAVRSFVPALREDRVLSGDIEAMAAAVRTGKFDGWRN
jgi:histidine ammonia-lyase